MVLTEPGAQAARPGLPGHQTFRRQEKDTNREGTERATRMGPDCVLTLAALPCSTLGTGCTAAWSSDTGD